MAIVNMTKFRLTLFAEDCPSLLENLQAFDWVDFVDLHKDEEMAELLQSVDAGPSLSASEEELSRLEDAIRLLQDYEEKDTSLKAKYSDQLPSLSYAEAEAMTREEAPDQTASEALQRAQAMESSKERIRSLKEEIGELAKWKKLDVPLDELKSPRDVQVLLGTLPARWIDECRRFVAEQAQKTYLEILSSNDKTAFVLILSRDQSQELDDFLRDISFSPAHFTDSGTIAEAIADREDQIRAEEKAIAQHKVHLKELARDKLPALKAAFELQAHNRSRLAVSGKTLTSQRVRFLEGYVPTDKLEAFDQVLQKSLPPGRYDLETQPAEREDAEVPILLKNNKLFSNFESIVQTYALPLYKEMDPTPLYAPWYIFFFGFMMGDLGYGLVMLALTTWALHYFNFKDSTRQKVRFLQIMSYPTIVAGLCFGSMFGGLVPLKPLIIDPTADVMTMIIFSVVVGIAHIFFALGLAAAQDYRMKDPKAAFYDVYAWYMLLIGLMLGALGKRWGWPVPVYKGLFILAGVGAVIIVLFSARDEKGGARYAWGLYNLYGMTSYVGDFASYTRLMALCLSGAYIGYSFNMICQMMAKNLPLTIVAVIVGIFLHLFNLFLSALSAYVHSMRLTYVEFFGKFYEGGGKAFKKMRPEAKYVNLE